MKQMTLYFVTSVAGLTVCGLLVLRHACRTAPLMPPSYDPPTPLQRNRERGNRSQERSRPACRTGGTPSATANRRLMGILRREELKQRPWEGRN